MHGIRVLKAFGRGKHALSKFARRPRRCARPSSARPAPSASSGSGSCCGPDVAFALCLAAGILLNLAGQLTVAELFAFFAMATVLRWPMESIGFLFSFLLDARTATDRIFEVFDEQNTISDPARPCDDR